MHASRLGGGIAQLFFGYFVDGGDPAGEIVGEQNVVGILVQIAITFFALAIQIDVHAGVAGPGFRFLNPSQQVTGAKKSGEQQQKSSGADNFQSVSFVGSRGFAEIAEKA